MSKKLAQNFVKSVFKNDYGEPFIQTDGQADIFNSIFLKRNPRVQILGATQYGKSDNIAMALVARSVAYNEKWAIIAGQKEKAQIIMEKVIQHTFDHPRFYKQLEIDSSFSLDRLRRERSKDNITWLHGGGIKTYTANTRNKNAVKEALSGFGSQNIVEDESALIPDDVHGMVMRMLGGHKNNFLLKIGNPYYRNHFYRTWQSERYYKIFIDYHQALKEGRYSEDFIEEMRNEPFFDILYECKFPDKDEYLADGYRQLISDELLQNAFISQDEAKELMIGQTKLGCDFAGGGNDRSAYIIRWPKVLKLIETNRIADTMQQVPIIERLVDTYEVEDKDIAVDYGGLGQGVGDRLRERDHFVNCVHFGQRSPEPDKYKNMRAYMYYQLFIWLKQGGKIIKDDGFLEFNIVNYKEDSERKFQIQPKEDLKKITKKLNLPISSPDIADAAALTFADNSTLIDEDDFDVI